MSFPQLSTPAALALLLLLAAAIVALHLLRPRVARAVVGSNLLWALVLGRRTQRNPRWRWWLTVLLALAIGLGLLLAALLPTSLIAQAPAQRVLLVIDNAPSMQARMRDGRSRLAHAREAAAAWLRSQGDGVAVRVADTMGLAPLGDFVPPARALEALRGVPAAASGTPRLPALLTGSATPLHLFTDGVMLAHAPGATVHRVFEPADNIAITAFDVRRAPGAPARSDALVQLFNASPRALRARLLLRGQDGFSLTRDLQLGAGELADLTLDVSRAAGVLAAGVSAAGDAFALDDIAYAVAPQRAPRAVLLVTPGDAQLEDSLRALPDVQLRVVRPQDYAAQAGFEAYVFDRFAPAQPPPAGSIVLGAGDAAWLPRAGERLMQPAIASWDTAHPVGASLQWSNLRLRAARALQGGTPLVRDAHGAALVVAASEPQPLVVAGFAAVESNLALQPGFPAFLGRALEWVSARTAPLHAAPGAIDLPMVQAQVSDGSGGRVASTALPEATRFVAMQPDVYTARSAGRSLTVVVNRNDPEFSRINQVRLQDDAPARSVTAPGGTAPWLALLAAVFALLLLDWTAWLRRLTA